VDREAVRRLAEARAEIADLRAENTRLRGLLGMETRPGDGHRRAWAPTLLSQPAEVSPIDAAAPIEQKLALVRSLFGARTDVFATRWENA
jgi:hypothetical protein